MKGPPTALLDTSALIKLDRIDDPLRLPQQSRISAVTLAELSVGPLVTRSNAERAIRQARLQFAESSFDALPFDADVARVFGRVSADLRRSGRKITARSFDAMIAATALFHGLPLVTANPRDFDGIGELEVITL